MVITGSTRGSRPAPVGEWVEHWLNHISKANTGGNGWDAYYYATKHIVRHVGAHRLTNLLPDHLERMYSRMQDSGSSAATAHQVHRTVRTALNEAVKRGYLTKNPALIAKPPRLDEEEIEPLNRAEITKLFATALEGRNAARWVVAIALGLRQGEALGLRWRDVDFEEGTLTVAVQRPRPKWQHGCAGSCGHKHAGHCPRRVNKRKATAQPKSKAGRRTIGLPAGAGCPGPGGDADHGLVQCGARLALPARHRPHPRTRRHTGRHAPLGTATDRQMRRELRRGLGQRVHQDRCIRCRAWSGGGSGGIRTPGPSRDSRFQGECIRPLCHASVDQPSEPRQVLDQRR